MTDEISYGAQLTKVAAERGSDVDLIYVRVDGTEVGVDWATLERRANQIARRFAEQAGVGDIVALVLPNSVEHILATLAVWKMGGTALPLRYDLPEWELQRLLDLAGPKVVVGPAGTAPGCITLDDLLATESLDASVLPDTVSECTQLVASSGSTGSPKLIVAPARGVLAGDVQSTIMGRAAAQITLVVSPLYHVNGFAFAAPGLLEGNRVVVMERFDAALAVQLIEKHQVTFTIMVPTMLQRIARLPDVRPEQLASIQRLIYGGATIPEWVVERWLELIKPAAFTLTYGSSERLGLCMMTGEDWAAHPGSTGRCVDAEMKVLGPDGQEVPPGVVGDVHFRPFSGRAVFRYIGIDMPAATADGYMTIGDLGWVDEDGYLRIVDRRTDMIVTGGANVFPAEVEKALSEHPEVADQVVVGLADAEWGRRVHAIVQPRDPARPPSAEDLRAHCKARLAGYKVPKSYEILDPIPRSAAGKINRTQLAEARDQS